MNAFPGSVDDIIEHYRKEQIVEGYTLKDPVSIQVKKYLKLSIQISQHHRNIMAVKISIRIHNCF